MNEEKLVQEEIRHIENNATKLYSYLYDLYYMGRIKNVSIIEKFLASYLDDRRPAIRRVAIYGLLFGLKIRHEKYRSVALRYINDPDSDFDLRMFSLSGLSQAYMGTSDVELLKFFYSFYSRDEDADIRVTCFAGMLRILGLSTVEITRINGSVIIMEDDIQTKFFANQLDEIRAIIST
ncbi:hypothetical protein SAMN04488128_105135 [Chitinophaga eiseniae]|uniref:HEAT repeat-containing protein n=1 Tax=Chitinophaga eiseniae TaxID=634771 RepID=A0A1T4TI67_9BACT|nr:hypothetical protein [Chitinophaga eiseniae]SKA40185.1 hypothetical protein SAMN04488128_105135 [Chitinophaga eiseniae]